ncbi:EAL domain-containing protein [uncultured Eubacterium sp.]|uniref:EAL domain-containing protein n=1 Tax=uncultured Eubacterium sp. TaxID=165185 RepID=UPI0025CE30B0|nr:EAL domain-containing protein [uncultured Eubacterium sp.]MCI6538350.1 EAL domain-containing protein [Lachnospiraceae bacterium]
MAHRQRISLFYLWTYDLIWYGCNILVNLFYYKQLRKRFLPLVEISLLMLGGMILQHVFRVQLFVGFTAALSITVLHLTLHSPSAYLDFNTEVFNASYFDYWITEQFQKKSDAAVTMIEFSRLEQLCNIYPIKISRKLVVDIAEKLWQITPHHRVFRLSFNRFVLCTCSDVEKSYMQAQLKQLSSEYCLTTSDISCPALVYDAGKLKNLPDAKSLYGFMDFLLQHTEQSEESQFHKCTEETYQQFFYEQEVEQFLGEAVQKDLFEIWFQPIYSVSEQRFSTLEALSRLKHPKHGWISPELFINRIACKNNMIYQITPLQLKKICRFLKQNQDLRQQIKTVKVNLTPNELLKPDYCEQLISIIRAEGIPTSCFQFEITETSATRYTKETKQCLKKLAAAGIGLCLDDFGSGYANLNSILRLPFSVIKMDRSLLFRLCEDETARTFYHNMITTLKAMGYQIVAEGIETKEEADYIQAWNVDLIQGYYYSPPLSEQKLLTLFSSKEETPCESH